MINKNENKHIVSGSVFKCVKHFCTKARNVQDRRSDNLAYGHYRLQMSCYKLQPNANELQIVMGVILRRCPKSSLCCCQRSLR